MARRLCYGNALLLALLSTGRVNIHVEVYAHICVQKECQALSPACHSMAPTKQATQAYLQQTLPKECQSKKTQAVRQKCAYKKHSHCQCSWLALLSNHERLHWGDESLL